MCRSPTIFNDYVHQQPSELTPQEAIATDKHKKHHDVRPGLPLDARKVRIYSIKLLEDGERVIFKTTFGQIEIHQGFCVGL